MRHNLGWTSYLTIFPRTLPAVAASHLTLYVDRGNGVNTPIVAIPNGIDLSGTGLGQVSV